MQKDTITAHATPTANPDELELVNALSAALEAPADKPLPESIQWMPPGRHAIVAHKGGKPAALTVTVDAKTAETVRASFLALQAKGKRPFLDLNHKGDAASARVVDIFWGGDDPRSGGVRARVDWTKPGEDALRGRAYSHFSPTFHFDAKTGRVSGSTVNMGGLVNDPAFGSIAPVMGRSATNNPNTMEKLIAAIVSTGLITAAMNDEEAAAAFSAAFAPIKARAATVEDLEKKLEAANATITASAAKLEEHKRSHAKTLVDAAAADGRLPAKDDATRKFWEDTLVTAGAPAEAALAAMRPDPAFSTVVKVDAKDAAGLAGSAKAAKQEAAVSAQRAKTPGISYDAAWEAAAAADPELFK